MAVDVRAVLRRKGDVTHGASQDPQAPTEGQAVTVSREVTVWCDECGNWTYGGRSPERTAADARKVAAGVGWTHRGGRDLCWACSRRPCNGERPHAGPWARIAGSDASQCACGFVSGK